MRGEVWVRRSPGREATELRGEPSGGVATEEETEEESEAEASVHESNRLTASRDASPGVSATSSQYDLFTYTGCSLRFRVALCQIQFKFLLIQLFHEFAFIDHLQ